MVDHLFPTLWLLSMFLGVALASDLTLHSEGTTLHRLSDDDTVTKYVAGVLDMLYPFPTQAAVATKLPVNFSKSGHQLRGVPHGNTHIGSTTSPDNWRATMSAWMTILRPADRGATGSDKHGSTNLIPEAIKMFHKADKMRAEGNGKEADRLSTEASKNLKVAIDNAMNAMKIHIAPGQMAKLAQQSVIWWRKQIPQMKAGEAKNGSSVCDILEIIAQLYAPQETSAPVETNFAVSPSERLVAIRKQRSAVREMIKEVDSMRDKLLQIKGHEHAKEVTQVVSISKQDEDIQNIQRVVDAYEAEHQKYIKIDPTSNADNVKPKVSVIEDIDNSPDIRTAEKKILDQIG